MTLLATIWQWIKRFLKFLLAYVSFTILLMFVFSYGVRYYKTHYVHPNSVLTIKLDSPITDKESHFFLNFRNELSLQHLRRALQQAALDPRIKGVVIEAYTENVAGWAQLEELRRLIEALKAKKKFVYFYTDTFGENANASPLYYLASSCDKIVMQHGGTLCFLGLAIETFFAKDFLDFMNLKIDIFKQKEYKGAADFALYNDFAPEVRENLLRVISEISNDIKQGVAHDRGKTVTEINDLLKIAPLNDEQSLNLGYVDALLYRHNFEESLKDYKRLDILKYPIAPMAQRGSKKVAILFCEGMIVKYEPGITTSKTFNDRHFEKMIDALIKQKYHGIIIRVNSRGGSATASEAMYGALLKAKKNGIKIVVSMGDYAASGGYFIAAASDKIVAESCTLTGSIGVINGKLNTKKSWDRLGVHWRILQQGENSGMFSTSQDLLSEQKEKMMNLTKHVYQSFVAKVAAGRNMSLEAVDSIAKGQVWTGKTAKTLGLVDELGGIEAAETLMRTLLKDKNVTFVDTKDTDFFNIWTQLFGEAQMSIKSSLWSQLKCCMNMIEGRHFL